MLFKASLKFLLVPAVISAILSFSGMVAASTSEAEMVRPVSGLMSPIFPAGRPGKASFVPPGTSFGVEGRCPGGYVVTHERERYIAGYEYFAPDYLLERGRGTSSVSLAASGFSAAALPAELERSEFFFTSAGRKTFYAMAFLLFLSRGGGTGFDADLRNFDEYLSAAGAVNGKIRLFEAFSGFLGGAAIRTRLFADGNLTYDELRQCLRFKKPVVFMTGSRDSSGEIIVAFELDEPSRDYQLIRMYSYPSGIFTVTRGEAKGLLAGSVPGYLVIL